MRKSFFGSVKDKLSRKSSDTTPSDPTTNKNIASARAPSPAPAPAQASAPAPTPAARTTNNNPFSNPSPATRRPEPPPAYADVPSIEVGTGPMPQNPTPAPRSTSPAPSHTSQVSLTSVTNEEDPYAFLAQFDTVFVIDDSGSMAGRSWREVKDALRAITPICTAHDADGIDLFFLNHKSAQPAVKGSAAGGFRGINDAARVENIFSTVRPSGGTPTGTRLHAILKPYLALCAANEADIESVKPINIIVITDGVPSDDVETVLINAAKKLDKIDAPPYQVGIQFFQVGNEEGAREALKELDDGLAELVDGGVRDMVDTVTWNKGGDNTLSASNILKVVLGAVVKRLDRRRASGESRRSARHLAP
ncbi:hypothetical protein HYQ45_014855 [Verticillium longisporum]|uniref:VWFA domain-containing protein n=3 Tax=Verticillium TaxID=1036719 RepID=G2X1B1_VERDV|nr:uncharacterized protein VDAG_04040 [Verticillium dahliae VdLs.17]KAF3344096.1 hypothetical protein VdG2_08154 [Verticillium dahliae VDG2]KAF3359468.1 hypothetical protein VdG1_02023 [Verticillium dahliae VDG1]KAG7119717.1 hypothetical protein HYQ45_014855 [Verticillium longisporum]KAH6705035.1 hypothetical protein EV126DRAFT_200743 [Verticillium dahliae]EGY22602.1 hypothetical protein VDAG_04040 [Verticillium dahliae VdLs.17]